MRKVEILAPAGSYAGMQAAVNAGCDAVYIGGSRFGARAFAENLTEEDLKRAIDFVHLREKKLYLTINTLLKEEERREELYNYLLPFYEQGLDAVIVQDLGVMSFLHRNFPQLPIHASTQLSLTGSTGAEGLQPFGVTRFVPARELSLAELSQIRRETKLEIEVFVHGALCYCYSGQCLLSSMIGGRSGNRGRCAQPCRMQYRLEDGKKGYFMSPRDICTLELLPELIEAGIDSFKIEGRMKRPEYAALTSYLYGKYTDLYEELGRSGYVDYLKSHKKEFLQDKTALLDLYNRGGFSRGYFNQYHGKSMMALNRPNHSGVRVGYVSSAGKKNAVIELEQEVYAQDILELRNQREAAAYEFTLKEGAEPGEKITANILPGSRIYPQMQVYRTRNQRLLTELGERFSGQEPPICLSGIFRAVVGEPMQLTLICKRKEGGEAVIAVEGEETQKAQKQPMTEEKIKRAIMQMQDSGFFLEELRVELEEAVFIPVGKLKELRRRALAQLREAICQPYRRRASGRCIQPLSLQRAEEASERKIDALVLSGEQAEAVVASPAGRIYLSWSLYQECRQAGIDFAGKEVVFTLPYIIRENNRSRIWREISEICDRQEQGGFLVRNLEELFWLLQKTERKSWRLFLDSNLYALNQEAEAFYRTLGAEEVTASLEQTREELLEAGCQGKSLLVYGHIPLMITAQCMIDNVYGCSQREGFMPFYDRKGKRLLLHNCCRECYNIIYEGTPLCLLEEKEAVKQLSPKRLRLDFTVEEKEETEAVLRAAFSAFGPAYGKEAFPRDITKGHFYRGVE